MEIENIEAKTVRGLVIRTTNKDEMNPSTAKIGDLYQKFDDNIEVDYRSGNRVYGVYFNYESDASAEFSVLAGTVLAGTDQADINTNEELQTLDIKAGKYLVFHARGEVPQIVIETWSKVWEYFSGTDCNYRRSYKTDFEYYVSQNEIKVHIGVE